MIAILMPTCDKYEWVAKITLKWLRHYWKDHPPVYVCGAHSFSGEQSLAFTCDPRDWIGIAWEAVSYLEDQGFTYCYLVLDDHPPVGSCNTEFLNIILPQLAQQLDAVQVSLSGWDQFRPSQGRVLGRENCYLMENDSNFRWSFNLHPGLWKVASLQRILETLKEEGTPQWSARDFEARVRSLQSNRQDMREHSAYRICADKYAVGNRWFQGSIKRKIIVQFIHLFRLVGFCLGGNRLRGKIDKKIRVYQDYLNGPYPMYWSGLMSKGRVHGNMIRFLQLIHDSAFLQTIKSAVESRREDKAGSL